MNRKLTATHHILFMDIQSMWDANGQKPVQVSNPKTIDLIAAGLLEETADRQRSIIGGLNIVVFTVKVL